MQKPAERVLGIVSKRRPFYEAAPAIQSHCRFKGRSRTGLEANTSYSPCARRSKQVVKNGGSSAFAEKFRMRAHRFDFGSLVCEQLERAYARDAVCSPCS